MNHARYQYLVRACYTTENYMHAKSSLHATFRPDNTKAPQISSFHQTTQTSHTVGSEITTTPQSPMSPVLDTNGRFCFHFRYPGTDTFDLTDKEIVQVCNELTHM